MIVNKIVPKKNFLIFFEKYNFICLLITVAIFLLDRTSKQKLVELQMNENIIFINDFVNIDLVWNTGIGFGLFSSETTLIYNLITGLIGFVILFIFYLFLKSILIEKFFFSLIIGGALGNFYDRLIYQAVPDFIDFHIGNFHWFTFNVADIFITIGILMLLIRELFFKNETNN